MDPEDDILLSCVVILVYSSMVSWSAWWAYLWSSLQGPWAMSMDVQKIMQRVIMTLVAMRVPHWSAHYTCSVLLVLMGQQCPIPCVVASHGLNRCTGSALSYTYHCTGLFVINAPHSWKLWPLAWTCPISQKWLGWNIEWISRTLKDSPAFKQHYSYKNNRDTYINLPWALCWAACLPLRYFKRHKHTTAPLRI